jgi:hypothetical protein
MRQILKPLHMGLPLSALLLLGSCSDPLGPRCTPDEAEDCWSRMGLEGDVVRDIVDTPWGLYAAVGPRYRQPETSGLFRFDPHRRTWERVGFQGYEVSRFMYVPEPTPKLYLALVAKAPPLHLTEDGETWQPIPIVLSDGHRVGKATSLNFDPRDPNRIFVGGDMYMVFESRDAGRTWEWLHLHPDESFGGVVRFAGPSPHGRLWYGGQEAARGQMHGELFYSDDDGATWTSVFPRPLPGPWPDAPGILRDIVHHPTDPNTTMVMDGGIVLRTTDGAKTWRTVAQTERGLVRLLQWNDVLIAVGGDVLVSPDFGRRWQTRAHFPLVLEYGGDPIRFPQSATVDRAGRLLVGTTDGVWVLDEAL